MRHRKRRIFLTDTKDTKGYWVFLVFLIAIVVAIVLRGQGII